MSDWRSMETAPKNTPIILLTGAGAVGEGQWEEDAGWYWAGSHSTDAPAGISRADSISSRDVLR